MPSHKTITRRVAMAGLIALPFHRRELLPECKSEFGESWQEVAIELAGWEYRAITQEFRGWRSIHCTCCIQFKKDVAAFVGFGQPSRVTYYRESIVDMLRDCWVTILGDAVNPNVWSFAVCVHADKARFIGLERRWNFGRQPHNAY